MGGGEPEKKKRGKRKKEGTLRISDQGGGTGFQLPEGGEVANPPLEDRVVEGRKRI